MPLLPAPLQQVAEAEAQNPPVARAASHQPALAPWPWQQPLLLTWHPDQQLARGQLAHYSLGPSWTGYQGLALLQEGPGYWWGPAERVVQGHLHGRASLPVHLASVPGVVPALSECCGPYV